MDITSVITYLKELLATVMVLVTMLMPGGTKASTATFEALNPVELVASFVVLSDIHVETNQPESYGDLSDVLKGVKAGKNVDAVIYTGDNVMNGQVLENYLFYSAVRTMKPSDNNFVLAGNHDLGNSAGDYEKLLGDLLAPYIGNGIKLGGYNIFSVENLMWFIDDLLGQVYDLYIADENALFDLVDGLVEKLTSFEVSDICIYTGALYL